MIISAKSKFIIGTGMICLTTSLVFAGCHNESPPQPTNSLAVSASPTATVTKNTSDPKVLKLPTLEKGNYPELASIDLYKDYASLSLSEANKKYKGKTFVITGEMTSIGLTNSVTNITGVTPGSPYINFKNHATTALEYNSGEIKCYFTPEDKDLMMSQKANGKISFFGEVDGFRGMMVNTKPDIYKVAYFIIVRQCRFNDSKITKEPKTAPILVDSKNIDKQFNANPEQYRRKSVEVKGKVEAVTVLDKDVPIKGVSKGQVCVTMKATTDDVTFDEGEAEFYFDEKDTNKTKNIKPGQNVVIRGNYTGELFADLVPRPFIFEGCSLK